MQYRPTLIINRVVVERNQFVVYDGVFHRGVNILRGDNSSGKSTILNFIFYGLGGDLTDWSDVAQLCTRVIIEASFNGMVATLAREISTEAGRPMDIFAGSYAAAINAPSGQWKRYPYRRSTSLESFSQVIFRLLDIPEVASDETGNLTIHQILRLLYADQLSPVEQIFKFERFDPPVLRDTVGRLLCGAYDSEVYNNDVALKGLIKEFDSISSELRSLFSVLGKTDQAHTLDWIEGQRRVLEEARNKIQEDIEQAEQLLFTAGAKDELTLKAQENAYAEVQSFQRELADSREERDRLALTIADSDLFIASLEVKIEALADSKTVADTLGGIQFRACPACYAPLQEIDSDHSCHLCKTPFDTGAGQNRIVALINENARQLKQSRLLQSKRRIRLEELEARSRSLHEDWVRASRRLSQSQTLPSSEARTELRTLTREAGYLDRKAEDLAAKVTLANEINKLTMEKDELNAKITRLRTRNEQLRFTQAKRLSFSYALIEGEIKDLLHHDLRRQDAFVTANKVQFDFSANSLAVDGQTYFSASSRVILKSSFFIGFLQAARKDVNFRHPRFCMLDTIEDKGMEQVRSHNFQRLIVDKSKSLQVEHQIIFATAMIAPELDDPKFTVGDHSTLDNPTIKIMRPKALV